MEQIKIGKIKKLRGEFYAPADKSISQRAVLIGAIAKGVSCIHNFLDADDTRGAIGAFARMNVKMKLSRIRRENILEIHGRNLYGLRQPKNKIFLGNSGTTMRLICGILAAQKFSCELCGDDSLNQRPMKRIVEPLSLMGAEISGRKIKREIYAPLKIAGHNLKGISYKLPLQSAQVKSALLLAGLYAKGKTCVYEKLKTRDHTERMLRAFGADIKEVGLGVTVRGQKELVSPKTLWIPGDLSSVLFFIVAAIILPGSKILIRNLGLNPTRSYILKVLKRMGADIEFIRTGKNDFGFEPVADIKVRSSRLRATTLNSNEAAYCIDELPAFFVAACFAKGITRVYNASELRVKETDRIFSMITNLKLMGADIANKKDAVIIKGTACLSRAQVESFGDHRTAMSMVVAASAASGKTIIKDTGCINKSFPDFMKVFNKLAF
ncbi:MAG: 3-phosphoshikimate 1-carboxyvinyltransferase [Candidatus Omnitrophica bacterium]|nr:3-phosphoshikimate 1-carboxyvinyltransferase [Candidatus Omnitrophota bacterium]MBU1925808.1 3-phosphoshikimate 1-carboxyvinyltransferase [Candidatus Omnitrophota bacterium]